MNWEMNPVVGDKDKHIDTSTVLFLFVVVGSWNKALIKRSIFICEIMQAVGKCEMQSSC